MKKGRMTDKIILPFSFIFSLRLLRHVLEFLQKSEHYQCTYQT